ncbi:cell division control protein 54 [Hypoxylon fragiforme]|uniref:cell division control protein 54 n=1 Tax=Hypoxylon fragiforme TaxID=63214 RepID=UPI0020C6D93A|nr:cell division control protein 54 [Hypoxylon fragiforme]KAI2613698.1 cell division control protein 54 [Hypoxylon fragiforme]
MSSPSNRRTRSSQAGTPGRTTRNSLAPSSSPANGGSSQNGAPNRPSQLVSSPLFYQSSPANGNDRNSPALRHNTDSQSTNPNQNAAPSSPLQHMAGNDGDRTPRARSMMGGESSPIRYEASSSPGRALNPQSDLRSESSNLFVGPSDTPRASRVNRRGDINSEIFSSTGRSGGSRVILDDAGRVVREIHSDAATFSNLNPNTTDADALGGQDNATIWGTTVSIDDTYAAFKDFLRNFTKKYRMWSLGMTTEETDAEPDATSKPYWEELQNMLILGQRILYVNVQDFKLYPPTRKMWHQIQHYPQEIVPLMDQSVHDLMIELAQAEMVKQRSQSNGASATQPSVPSSDMHVPSSERGDEPQSSQRPPQGPTLEEKVMDQTYMTRPFGLDEITNLRDLNPSDMDKLICIKGLVIRTTPVIPDMKQAFFRCSVCSHSLLVGLDRGKIREPTECPRQLCNSKNSMQIIHNRCEFEDKQVIKLQETPDAVPAGQTPHSVSVCVYNELVDFCKAGDRVKITGIYRVSPVRVNPRQRSVKSIFKTFVDVVHIAKVDNKRLDMDPSTLDEDTNDPENNIDEVRNITPEEEEKIKATAARPDIYELLSRSLAPSVYEMEDVKKGILLQMFGGTNKTFEKGGSPKYRGDINVLLCGDPSTSKSQLLKYIHKIAPRGVYTSGKGSSAVGLTAYVSRDPETRQLVLESGALVLSDGGVCCIDEFDKMSDSTRSVLHEVMEQQTVSVAKAGIITTLNARTSILASANPIGSRYNPDLPVPQNIDLPPTLLSRFDLVYLVLDRINESTDRRLARHLLSMYLEDKPQSASSNDEILPVEFLTSYISYARTHVHPTLSQDASQALVEAYVNMRKLGQDVRAAEKRITATTRQLESMIRLAEAHAKMRLAPVVTKADVLEAERLIQSALKTAATDSQGRIDMSLLTEGTSAAERKRKTELKAAVLQLLDELTSGGQSVRWSEVSRRLNEGASIPVEPADFAEVMRALEMDGSITISGEGARRSVRRMTTVA